MGLAATGGAHTVDDIVKLILAGADVVMLASALLQQGAGALSTLTEGLAAWLDAHGSGSVAEIRGLVSQTVVADPAAFERAQYIATLEHGL